MIRYALVCDNGHDFESWFRSSDDFDMQKQRRLVECPVCASPVVTKQVMAPQVARSDLAPADPATAPDSVALIDPEQEAMRRRISELHRHLADNSENVGARFADEARKIHYGESEARPIHGKASGEQARDLIEEGIAFLPLPTLPDERN